MFSGSYSECRSDRHLLRAFLTCAAPPQHLYNRRALAALDIRLSRPLGAVCQLWRASSNTPYRSTLQWNSIQTAQSYSVGLQNRQHHRSRQAATTVAHQHVRSPHLVHPSLPSHDGTLPHPVPTTRHSAYARSLWRSTHPSRARRDDDPRRFRPAHSQLSNESNQDTCHQLPSYAVRHQSWRSIMAVVDRLVPHLDAKARKARAEVHEEDGGCGV